MAPAPQIQGESMGSDTLLTNSLPQAQTTRGSELLAIFLLNEDTGMWVVGDDKGHRGAWEGAPVLR